jgi:hypothetical protein
VQTKKGIMLEENCKYHDNKNKLIYIVGKIKEYSNQKPYLYSQCGNWYDQNTGCFIMFNPSKGHFPLDSTNISSISNHIKK